MIAYYSSTNFYLEICTNLTRLPLENKAQKYVHKNEMNLNYYYFLGLTEVFKQSKSYIFHYLLSYKMVSTS